MLTPIDVAERSPATFAIKPKPGVSERYEFIPTSEILNHLTDNGYMIRNVSQRKSRSVDNQQYAKHLIQFRKQGQYQIDDIFPEGVLINSHDRTTALTFNIGLFRLVCANGMVIGESLIKPLKFNHSYKNPIDLVLDKIDGQWKLFEEIQPVIKTMREIILFPSQINDYCYKINKQFFDGKLINSSSLVDIKRQEDRGDSLWKIFNRAQENIMKGGLIIPNEMNGTKRKAKSPFRHLPSVRNIDKMINWNKELWDMTMDYVK